MDKHLTAGVEGINEALIPLHSTVMVQPKRVLNRLNSSEKSVFDYSARIGVALETREMHVSRRAPSCFR